MRKTFVTSASWVAKLGKLSVVGNILLCDVVGAETFSVQLEEGVGIAWRFPLISAHDGYFFSGDVVIATCRKRYSAPFSLAWLIQQVYM
jgi:hypothetical protein